MQPPAALPRRAAAAVREAAVTSRSTWRCSCPGRWLKASHLRSRRSNGVDPAKSRGSRVPQKAFSCRKPLQRTRRDDPAKNRDTPVSQKGRHSRMMLRRSREGNLAQSMDARASQKCLCHRRHHDPPQMGSSRGNISAGLGRRAAVKDPSAAAARTPGEGRGGGGRWPSPWSQK